MSVVVFMLQQTRTSLREADKACHEVGQNYRMSNYLVVTADSELAIEKEWRSTLGD